MESPGVRRGRGLSGVSPSGPGRRSAVVKRGGYLLLVSEGVGLPDRGMIHIRASIVEGEGYAGIGAASRERWSRQLLGAGSEAVKAESVV